MQRLILIIFCSAIMIIIISFTTGSNLTCDSPVVGDHSGAPGETNCSGCHSAPVNPDIPDLHFEVGNNDSTYIPGNTYLVHISMKRSGHDKFGFVCSSLDTLNTSKGTFDVINSTTTRKYTLGGRNYFSHTPCGADGKDSIDWTYNWTAPAIDKGKIKIYLSMLVANHNHALTGDTTYTRVITLNPKLTNNIRGSAQINKSVVYPTFFTSSVEIVFDKAYDNTSKEITLLSAEGKVVRQFSTTESRAVLNTEESLISGIYFLRIIYHNANETLKLFKK